MLETIEKVLVIAVILATAVERMIEIGKPLLLKIANADWQKAAKVACAVLVGFGLAALFQFTPLAEFGLKVPPVGDYAAAGLLLSFGASPLHAILEWLKTIKLPAPAA